MSATYESALIDATRCGKDVVMMRFERPTGFEFVPGQWLRLTLRTAEGAETRTFTIASARDDDWLEVATRISESPYKQALGALVPGSPVELAGPGGRMGLPEGTRRAVFLVGGVGVTPARGMLRDALQRGQKFDDVVVFYGNRDASCAPYLAEFEAMQPIGVHVIPVYQFPDPGSQDESGFITAELIRRHAETGDGRPFIVAGPPGMVAAMRDVLDELGISEDRRHIEWFGAVPK